MVEMDITRRKELDTMGSAVIDSFKEARQSDKSWGALYISCQMDEIRKNTALISSDCTGTARQIAFMVYSMMKDDSAFAKGVLGAVHQYNADRIKLN